MWLFFKCKPQKYAFINTIVIIVTPCFQLTNQKTNSSNMLILNIQFKVKVKYLATEIFV